MTEAAMFRSIIDDLAESVIVADRGGRFVLFNKAAESLLGIGAVDAEPEEWSGVYGCYRADRVTPFPPAELPLTKALAGEHVPDTEIFIRNPHRPEGVSILVRGSPLFSQSGELLGGLVVLRDITRRRQSDDKIQMLTSAVEQTADSILITDKHGTVEYVNPAFEATTGYAREEIIGRTPRLLKSGVHDAAFYREVWAKISGGRVFRGTITNRRKNGEIYFAEQTITPMRDSSGEITHFVSVLKDLTEQRRMREQEFHMSLARAVQQRFYQCQPLRINGFDIAGAAFPADQTGGDYFDILSLPGGHLGIFIGDVSGHGIGSALLMAQVRASIRAFARATADLEKILRLVNGALLADTEQNMFATLTSCRLHPNSRSLVYSSAGHVPCFVLDSRGTVRCVLESTDTPLGLFPDRSFPCGEKIELEPGDMLTLITDGITEAQGPEQTEFGVERALEYIRAHRRESAEQIVNGMYQAVREFTGGMAQIDDITAVVCKSADPPPGGAKAHKNGGDG